VTGNGGQRPFDMGYKVMYALRDTKDGEGPSPDPTYTRLDICTPKNVDTCIGGAK
jgi:ribose transport system substrate-binding protein